MDVNAIFQLVGSLGAPIVMAFVLLKMMQDNNKAHSEEVKALSEKHSDDVKKMTDELHENNVAVIQKLSDVAVSLAQLVDRIDGAE